MAKLDLDRLDLASVEGVATLVRRTDVLTGENSVVAGHIYCPSCGELRRVSATCFLTSKLRQANWPTEITAESANTILHYVKPALLIYKCVQCDNLFTVVVYQGPQGPDVAILGSQSGGLSTPHTPPGVAFYLDQAHRAESVSANSAAIAMMRGALEHLLYEQGYIQGMLNNKIQQLEKDIADQKAPKWALDLDTAFLGVIKDLGNASIHPNDGDVTKQANLDRGLIALVRQTFSMLLFLVYEVPHKKQNLLDKLTSTANILKK
ncbi:MAG TPA: DUF4145 domain-containing protein [Aggregatilinea sp.]|uniref:DUF4145 domain-containing protein n=1 Tax=Aggregatilinea sp. TaxID=2806333 RepID=UPI002C25AFE5|nr:DUF4145 domain-containing protein [Aggregatilinea sp.]HML24720.1 DUF4145 domain-containing protein [Aggregatilinea sp.]